MNANCAVLYMIVQLLTGVVWLHVNTNCTVLYMIVQLMKCVVMLVHVNTHSIITVPNFTIH